MTKTLLLLAAVAAAVLLLEFVFPGIKTLLRRSRTALRLSTLPGSEYIVVTDISIGPRSRSAVKIDYAVVSRHGIFVIQEKPLGGRIFGKVTDERWVRRVLWKEETFKNPLIRSRNQIYALCDVLNLEPSVFIPVVVFSGGGSSWVDTTALIVSGFEMKKAILSHKDILLDTDTMQNAAITLGELR